MRVTNTFRINGDDLITPDRVYYDVVNDFSRLESALSDYISGFNNLTRIDKITRDKVTVTYNVKQSKKKS